MVHIFRKIRLTDVFQRKSLARSPQFPGYWTNCLASVIISRTCVLKSTARRRKKKMENLPNRSQANSKNCSSVDAQLCVAHASLCSTHLLVACEIPSYSCRKTKHLQSERRVPCDRRRQPQGRAGVGRPAAAAEGARISSAGRKSSSCRLARLKMILAQ